MDLEHLAFFAQILSTTVFFLTEKIISQQRTRWTKVAPTTAIHGMNIAISLILSLALLVPLVHLVAPLQVFSLSEWDVPVWVSFAASFLLLDAIHYGSHRLHHSIPLLWRLHRLHHSDRDVDAFTTVLHHPLEGATGFVGVVVIAVLFDVPVIVLTTYAIVSGFHSAFTHLNCELPERVDRFLKWIVITPNFHRAHHSLDMHAGNSNFGLVFVFWDYLFMTAFSKNWHEPTVFGIAENQMPRQNSIGAYLANPLR